MFRIFYIVLFILFHEGSSVIYHLNDTEYARMPPLFALDDYDSCLQENDGLYCVLRLDLVDDPENDLMKLVKEYSKVTLEHYNHSYIERGVCVKKTCNAFIKDHTLNDSADLTYILEECLNTTIFRSYKVQSKISQVYYCNRNDAKNDISLLDWCAAGVFYAIVLINLIGSLYDYILNNRQDKKEQGNKYLLSFSVKRNWELLVNSTFEDPKLRRLKSLHGLRTITNIIMIYFHTICLIATGFTDRPHLFEKSYNSSVYRLLYNGLMVIQIFSLMSGFLMTYNFLARTESVKSRTTWIKIPRDVFLRWWRLTPALAMMIAFTMTWLRHLGSGPLWNFYVTNSVAQGCRKYWWSHIFYFNNFLPHNRHCATHTWHIAADSQLFLVGLVVLVATMSRGRIVVLAFLLFLSLILPALHVWLHDLDAMAVLTPEVFRAFHSDTLYYLHINGLNNISSYTIGMIMAILIRKWQNKGVIVSENKMYTALLWLAIPGMLGVIHLGSFFYNEKEKSSLVARMLYAATHRFIFSIITAFGMIGMIMKYRMNLRDIFEWRGWVVPSKLTYSVYLIHFNFIYILLGVKYTMLPVSFWFMNTYFFGIATMSYLLAVPFYLMVEAPLDRLIKNITSTNLKSPSNKKE